MFKYDGKGINIITGFDLTAQAPLDSRSVVESLSALKSLPTNRLYEGLDVYVIENKTKYTYVKVGVDETTNENKYDWRKAISQDDVFVVIDNLTSESATDALSAKQGKALKDSLDATDDALDALTTRVTTAEGDIDKLETTTTNHETRLTTAESNITRIDGDDTVEGSFRNLIKKTKEAHDQDINAHDGRLDELETASSNYSDRLNTLEGDDTTEGSVAKAVKDSADAVTSAWKAADSAITTTIADNKTAIEKSLADEVSARQLLDTTIHTELADTDTAIRKDFADADSDLSDRITQNATDIATNREDIDEIAESLNSTITVVNTHTTALTTLNGDANVEGSVDYKIKKTIDEVAYDISVVGSHRNIVESVEIKEDGQTGITFGYAIPDGYNVAEDGITVIVNGLTYAEGTAFVVNRTGAVLRWTLDSTNGGFNLETDDVFEVEYSVRKASTVAYERISVDLVNTTITPEGDFDDDPASYVEDIDLSAYNIQNYYATIINGITYTGEQAKYDAESGILSIAGVNTEATDTFYVVVANPVE